MTMETWVKADYWTSRVNEHWWMIICWSHGQSSVVVDRIGLEADADAIIRNHDRVQALERGEIECIHCGELIPAAKLDHWRECTEHPANAAITALERQLEQARAIVGLAELAKEIRAARDVMKGTPWLRDWCKRYDTIALTASPAQPTEGAQS